MHDKQVLWSHVKYVIYETILKYFGFWNDKL